MSATRKGANRGARDAEGSDRYAVFVPRTGRYAAGAYGLAWTRDRKEADDTASMMDGVVVDADDFSVNWPLYVLTAALAGEMPVDVATTRIPAEWLPTPRAAHTRTRWKDGET